MKAQTRQHQLCSAITWRQFERFYPTWRRCGLCWCGRRIPWCLLPCCFLSWPQLTSAGFISILTQYLKWRTCLASDLHWKRSEAWKLAKGHAEHVWLMLPAPPAGPGGVGPRSGPRSVCNVSATSRENGHGAFGKHTLCFTVKLSPRGGKMVPHHSKIGSVKFPWSSSLLFVSLAYQGCRLLLLPFGLWIVLVLSSRFILMLCATGTHQAQKSILKQSFSHW